MKNLNFYNRMKYGFHMVVICVSWNQFHFTYFWNVCKHRLLKQKSFTVSLAVTMMVFCCRASLTKLSCELYHTLRAVCPIYLKASKSWNLLKIFGSMHLVYIPPYLPWKFVSTRYPCIFVASPCYWEYLYIFHATEKVKGCQCPSLIHRSCPPIDIGEDMIIFYFRERYKKNESVGLQES